MAGSLRKELYRYAVTDNWDQARSIFDEYPHMIRSQLTTFGDTALHIAATANSSRVVQGLVSLHLMTPEDLEIQNSNANTAFCLAAMLGNSGLFESMMGKNHNLPLIPGHNGMLPVHMAALFGYHNTVEALSTENLLERMAPKQIELLFFTTISSGIYGKSKQ